MTYANSAERSDLIAGLRALADFLESRLEIPAPRWTEVMVFLPASADSEKTAEIDAIAALIGAASTIRPRTAATTPRRAASALCNTARSRSRQAHATTRTRRRER